MYFKKLKLSQFKNHASMDLVLGPGIHAFVGPNGSGKTNILDAIHLCCLGKSHFQYSDSQLIKFGNDFYRLDASIDNRDGVHQISIKMPRAKRKKMILDGKEIKRLSEYIGRFPLVFLSPDDIYQLLEGSQQRRRYLDQALTQIKSGYLQYWMEYRRLLQQRNAFLKAGQKSGRLDAGLLQAYNEKMKAPAIEIYKARKSFVAELNPLFETVYQKISNGAEDAKLHYKCGLEIMDWDAWMETALEKDRILGRSTAGVHRDDLKFELSGKGLKKFGSQGQIKSFVLSLYLSMVLYFGKFVDESPVLVIDDVFAKLDMERVRAVLDFIRSLSVQQLFISDTDLQRIQRLEDKLEGGIQIHRLQKKNADEEE